jgi:hypothetical protein
LFLRAASVSTTNTTTRHGARRTPRQVAELYAVDVGKVLGWIHSGQLRAISVAARVGGRPRWRIDESDLLAFEQRREAVPTSPAPKPKRRPKLEKVVQYF